MSLNGEQLAEISQLVESSQTVVIVLSGSALTDEVAAALAWAALLRGKGKDVQVIAPQLPQVVRLGNEARGLEGAEDISTELGRQNLVISFTYSPEQVDKVSYHIGEETNRFYLTIKPKKGMPPLSSESLEMGYAGAEADLIVYIGVGDVAQLEPLSGEYGEFFRDTPSIALDSGETSMGLVNIQTSSAAGLSEESAQLFVQLGWELDAQAATLLLRGIEETTNGLTSLAATPDTFETVALLLRAGARRERVVTMRPSEKAVAVENETVEHVGSDPTDLDEAWFAQNQQEASVDELLDEVDSMLGETNDEHVPAAPKTFADVLNRGATPLPEGQQQPQKQTQDPSQHQNQYQVQSQSHPQSHQRHHSSSDIVKTEHSTPVGRRYQARKRHGHKPQQQQQS